MRFWSSVIALLLVHHAAAETISSRLSNKCIEMPYANKGNNVQVKQFNCLVNLSHFQLDVRPKGDFFQLQFRHSNKCVGVKNGLSGAGAPVVQTPCRDGVDSQLWQVNGSGAQKQIVVKHTRMCMTLANSDKRNGAGIIQFPCAVGAKNNYWKISANAPSATPSPPAPVGNAPVGNYVEIISQRSNQCAEMPFASRNDDAGMAQWPCLPKQHYHFTFEPQGNGYYHVKYRHSGKCVSVRGRSTQDNAQMVQDTCGNNVDSQLWQVRGSGAKQQIVAKHSQKCMSLQNGSLQNAAPIVQNRCQDAPAFHWRFNVVGSSPTGTPPTNPTPPTNTFSSKWDGPYRMSIVPVAAANLPDGRILSWSAYSRMNFGGNGGQTWIATFNPINNLSSEALIKNTNHDMFCPGTAVLPDGRIAITGGSRSEALTIYNPAGNSWTRGPNMKIKRGYHSMTMLPDGTVFTLGGSWSGGRGGKDGEVWNPSSNSWQRKNNIKSAGSLLTNDKEGVYRSDNHMWLFTAPNGKVFHAGPSVRTHWITTGGAGSVSQSVIRDTVAAMNGNAVMYDIGKILTMGGAKDYNNSPANNRAHIIDLNKGDNASVKRVGNMKTARVFHNSVVLPSGEVVVVGGQTRARIFTDSNRVLTAEIWNPQTGEFRNLASMDVPRTYHSVAILMKDGRVWVGGGGLCGTCNTNHLDSEIFTPPYLLESNGRPAARPVILSATGSSRAGNVITVRVNSNAPHTFAVVRLSAVTHSVNNDGRRFPLAVASRNGDTFRLKIPNNRAVALAGSYFLFAMNGAGVPSVARILRIDP